MSKTKDLTTGNLWRKMLLFSLPLMASNLIQVLFNMSDVAIVGRFGSVEALGAVGSTPMIVFLFTGIFLGIGGGINAVTAMYVGARLKKDIRESVHTSFIISFAISIIILIVGEIFTVPLLNLIGTKSELIGQATIYLRIYFLGFPAQAIYNCGDGLYSAIGDTKKPLIFLSISGIINVCLNLFFVIICHKEASGVAWATIIAQYIAASLFVITLARRSDELQLRLKYLKLSIPKLKQILRVGLPGSFQNVIFAISNLYIQAAVNSFSTVMVEGSAAAGNMDTIVYQTVFAVYVAGTSFIGQNYGAKNLKNIKKSYIISMVYSFGFMLLSGLAFYAFGRQFVGLFTTEEPVIEAGLLRLNIMALTVWGSSFMDNTTAACRGLGKTTVPTVMVIIGTCALRIAWIYTIFATYHTFFALFIMYIVSWLVTGPAIMIYFVKIYNDVKKEFRGIVKPKNIELELD